MLILDLDKIPSGAYFTFVRSTGEVKPVVFFAMSSDPDEILAGPDVIVTQSQLDEALNSIGKMCERRREEAKQKSEAKAP